MKLEAILRCSNKYETATRLRVLLANVYHSQFLEIDEIKDQYDIVMKQIEREELFWHSNVAEKVDRALDRRLRLREQKVGVSSKVSTDKTKSKAPKQSVSKQTNEEFIYCNKFNRGTCTEHNTHTGRFAGRENVTLNHACKKCLREKGIRVGHAEIDVRCPYNANSN